MKLKYTAALLCVIAAQAGAQLAGPRLNSIIPDYDASVSRGSGLSVSTAPPTEARPVLVIDGAKLADEGYTSATDALGTLPGVFVDKSTQFGRADPNIRGLGSDGQRIALMVDGRPETTGIFGCTVTQTLPLDNIDRIEVVEGPASAQYGSGAMGGAVNILTHGATRPFEGDLQVGYGSDDTRLFRLRGGAQSGPNDFYAAVEQLGSAGYTNYSSYNADDGTFEYGRDLGDGAKLRIRHKLYSGTEYDPAPVDGPASDTSWFDYRRGDTDLAASVDRDNYSGAVRLFNTYGHHDFSSGWTSEDDTYGATASGVWKQSPDFSVNAGAEYERMDGDWIGVNSWDKNQYAVYTGAKKSLGNFLLVDGALRWTGDDGNPSNWVPALAASVKPFNEVEVYGSASRGLRFPALAELYLFPVSNPSLKPETDWGYESGVKYKPWEFVQLRGSAYMTEGDNLIEVDNSGRYSNSDAFLFRGVIGEAKFFPAKNMDVTASYTYLDPGSHSQGRPQDTASGEVAYHSGRDWGAAAQCLYAGRYYAQDNYAERINDIFTANLSAWKMVADGVKLSADVKNLLDRRYVVYSTNTTYTGQFLMPGITADASVTFSF